MATATARSSATPGWFMSMGITAAKDEWPSIFDYVKLGKSGATVQVILEDCLADNRRLYH